MNVLELDQVYKSFKQGLLGKKVPVIRGLSLSLAQGEVFGFLGHNGAGKTTTIKMILGLLKLDSGRITLFGQSGPTPAARRRIGFLGEEVGLYPGLNADEMLQLSGELYAIPRPALKERKIRLLNLVGLSDRPRLKIKSYSKGMRQRLGLAIALLNDPELLILDEPYSGLDPIGRRELRKLLLSLKEAGKTILMSSHIVPDVEAVCDRVGVLSGGSISKFLDLREIYATKANEVEITATGVAASKLAQEIGRLDTILERSEAVIVRCHGEPELQEIVTAVYRLGGSVLEVKPLRFSLEDHLMEALAQARQEKQSIRDEIELLLSR
jgi:ABC-2 type transport system ATP-binding protein